MAVHVLLLGANDVALMRQAITLFEEVFEEEQEEPPSAAWLEGLLASDRFVALVAVDDEVDNAVVGAATMHLLPNYGNGKQDGYIYDLGVAPGHRRRGIASLLMQALAEDAQTRAIGDLWLQAHGEDVEAVSFYESLGLEADDVKYFEFAPEKLSRQP